MNAENYVMCWYKKSEPEAVNRGKPFGIETAVFVLQDMTKLPVPYRSLGYIAQSIAEKANEKYPELHHWVEEAK